MRFAYHTLSRLRLCPRAGFAETHRAFHCGDHAEIRGGAKHVTVREHWQAHPGMYHFVCGFAVLKWRDCRLRLPHGCLSVLESKPQPLSREGLFDLALSMRYPLPFFPIPTGLTSRWHRTRLGPRLSVRVTNRRPTTAMAARRHPRTTRSPISPLTSLPTHGPRWS